MSTATALLTYDDLLRTPEDGKRYEIVGGEMFVSPSPAWLHQRISFELTLDVGGHVKRRRLGRLYPAPADVKLALHDIVVPDLFFISQERILPDGAPGYMEVVPDLVIEILSPSTRRRDLTVKQRLYERSGVREYWRVDPVAETITVFFLLDGRYVELPPEGDILRSAVLPDLNLNVPALFAAARQ